MNIVITNQDLLEIANIALDEENISQEEFNQMIANPIEFNNGACTAFAYHFVTTIKDAIIGDSTEYYDTIKLDIPNFHYGSHYHMFIIINDKYYDYEALEGKSKITDLPFFIRLKNKLK